LLRSPDEAAVIGNGHHILQVAQRQSRQVHRPHLSIGEAYKSAKIDIFHL
jgi:hypothetical protein